MTPKTVNFKTVLILISARTFDKSKHTSLLRIAFYGFSSVLHIRTIYSVPNQNNSSLVFDSIFWKPIKCLDQANGMFSLVKGIGPKDILISDQVTTNWRRKVVDRFYVERLEKSTRNILYPDICIIYSDIYICFL